MMIVHFLQLYVEKHHQALHLPCHSIIIVTSNAYITKISGMQSTTADIHVIMKQLYKNSSGEASCATYCKQYNCEVNIHTQVKFANLYIKYVNVRCLIKCVVLKRCFLHALFIT